jgi:predicted nucleic-acid-binding protein
MIGVDANILVRYAVKDDPQQTAQATDFLAKHRCFILKTVLLELVWVLGSKSGYDLSRELVLERVRHILGFLCWTGFATPSVTFKIAQK